MVKRLEFNLSGFLEAFHSEGLLELFHSQRVGKGLVKRPRGKTGKSQRAEAVKALKIAELSQVENIQRSGLGWVRLGWVGLRSRLGIEIGIRKSNTSRLTNLPRRIFFRLSTVLIEQYRRPLIYELLKVEKFLLQPY